MPGSRATATTVGMCLGIIRGPATDTTGIGAALNPGTGHTTTAAPMPCPGTAGTHLHITVMGPALGELGQRSGGLTLTNLARRAQSEREALATTCDLQKCRERPRLQVPVFACRAASLSISDCTAC